MPSTTAMNRHDATASKLLAARQFCVPDLLVRALDKVVMQCAGVLTSPVVPSVIGVQRHSSINPRAPWFVLSEYAECRQVSPTELPAMTTVAVSPP